MAVSRIPLTFQPTPKSTDGRLSLIWMIPQIAATILLTAGLLYTVIVKDHRISILLLFAIGQGMLQFLFLKQWMSADLLTRRRK